jgi:hypothetical protein
MLSTADGRVLDWSVGQAPEYIPFLDRIGDFDDHIFKNPGNNDI